MARAKTSMPKFPVGSPSLEIEIDPTGTVMYVRVSARDVAATREIERGLVADFDCRGALVGVEVIGLQKERVGAMFSSIRERFARDVPSLEHLSLIA